MADQRIADSGAGDDDVARLVALTERQHELWDLLRDAGDDRYRDQLLDELTANREELALLKERAAVSDIPLPAPRPPRPAPRPATEEGPRTVGEQLRSRIMGSSPGVAPPQPPPPPAPPAILIEPSAVQEVEVRVNLAPPDDDTAPTDEPVRAGTVSGARFPETGESEVPAVGTESDVSPSRVDPVVPPGPVESEAPGSGVEAVAGWRNVEPEVSKDRSWQPEPGVAARTDDEPEALLPERRPYRTREDDLAVSGARHEVTERYRPDPPPVRHTEEVLEELRQAAHATYREIDRVRPHPRTPSHTSLYPVLAILVAVAAVAASAWFLFFFDRQPGDRVPQTTTTTTVPSAETGPSSVEQIQAVVDGLGRGAVTVEESSGTIFLMGAVPTEADRETVVGAAEALAGTEPVNSSALSVIYHDDDLRITVLNAISGAGYDRLNASVANGVVTVSGVTPDDGATALVEVVAAVEGVTEVLDKTESADRAPVLEALLDRVTMITPIAFEEGQQGLNESQERILDDVAGVIVDYAGPTVKIVAYADDESVAAERANEARDRLVEQGVAADRLLPMASTQRASGLGPRIEFEVGYAVAARGTPDFRIGIVATGGRDGFASTQSIVDGALTVSAESADIGVDVSDAIATVAEAEVAIRGFARESYDIIIVHGPDLGPLVAAMAADFPNVAFVWGDSNDTFDLPNVSALDVAADEGGYVMGTLAARLTAAGVIGVVGPVDAGYDARYINGFAAGARAEDPGVTVASTYTGSTDDTALAAEIATSHIASGADVLTGSAGQVVGAIEIAAQNDVLWFGNQADQTRLAPENVVVSQVYHWEVALRQVVSGVGQGRLGGQTYTLNLANGGLVLEFNPDYTLPADLAAIADNVTAGLIDGSINTGA